MPFAPLFSLKLISVLEGLVCLLNLAGVFHLIKLIFVLLRRVLSGLIILILLVKILRLSLFGCLRSSSLCLRVHAISRFGHLLSFDLWFSKPIGSVFSLWLSLRDNPCHIRHSKNLIRWLERRGLHIQCKAIISVCHLSLGRNFDKIN